MLQVLTVVIWTGFLYLGLKTWSRVAPMSFTAAVAKVFPVQPPQ